MLAHIDLVWFPALLNTARIAALAYSGDRCAAMCKYESSLRPGGHAHILETRLAYCFERPPTCASCSCALTLKRTEQSRRLVKEQS